MFGLLTSISVPKDAWVRDDGEDYWKADAALAMNQIALAAFSEGLVAKFEENEAKESLGADFASRTTFLSPLGYRLENKGAITNRKKINFIVRYI